VWKRGNKRKRVQMFASMAL